MVSSSSSSQSTSVTNVREDYIFNNAGSGPSANVGKAGGDVNINMESLDAKVASDALEAMRQQSSDAFAQAFGFGSDAVATVGDTTQAALTANSDALRQAIDSIENQQYWSGQAIEKALGTVKSIGTGGASDAADTMKMLPIAAAVMVAVAFWGRK